jgi:hypothetical protein
MALVLYHLHTPSALGLIWGNFNVDKSNYQEKNNRSFCRFLVNTNSEPVRLHPKVARALFNIFSLIDWNKRVARIKVDFEIRKR